MAEPSETTHASGDHAETEREELVQAVHALSAQVAALQTELQSLREQGGGIQLRDERPGWDDRAPIPRDGSAWVRALDTPSARRLRVPWLALEIAFLVAVAVLAAVAGLDAPVIAAVMACAWALVAVAEWLTARAARTEQAILYGPASARVLEDTSWFAPPLDDSALDATEVETSGGTATRLPPPTE